MNDEAAIASMVATSVQIPPECQTTAGDRLVCFVVTGSDAVPIASFGDNQGFDEPDVLYVTGGGYEDFKGVRVVIVLSGKSQGKSMTINIAQSGLNPAAIAVIPAI